MIIEQVAEYKVACHLYNLDMELYGISMEDLAERTPQGSKVIRKISGIVKKDSRFSWPGCAFSMEMQFFPDRVSLVFSERIDDFLYNLKQTAVIMETSQARNLYEFIEEIEQLPEKEARKQIQHFEEKVQRYEN